MNKTILKQFVMLTKFVIYGMILQVLFLSVLVAHDGQAQRKKSVDDIEISIQTTESSLFEVFSIIENKTDLSFFYDESTVDKWQKVSLDKRKATVKEVLLDISRQTDLKFKQINEAINVCERSAASSKNSADYDIYYQQITISGKVTSAEDGEALPGVNVIIKGTSNGTVTDSNGDYQLDVGSSEEILVFSYVGFIPEEVVVSTRSVINIALAPDITSLGEIVVIGYGTANKSDVTGSLSSVNSEKIMQVPVNDLRQALQGRAAGVDVNYGSRRPGDSPEIRIRGERSLTAGNDPLYVIDGIPAFSMEDVNPSDVESIEVLKDASATAIYGSRAANGVVLITTKKGKTGKTRVTYDAYYGLSKPDHIIDMMDGAQFAEYRREAYRAVDDDDDAYTYPYPYADPVEDAKIFSEDPYSLESIYQGYEWEDYENKIVRRDENGIPIYHPGNVRSTDWMDFVLRTGKTQNHSLGISGGSDNTQFLFSGSYFQDIGMVLGQDFERFTLRLNLNHKVGDFLSFGLNSSFANSKQNRGANAYDQAMDMFPLASPYDEEGNLVNKPGGDDQIFNVLQDEENSIDERITRRLFAAMYAELNLLPGLTYRLNFGPEFRMYRQGQFYGALFSSQQRAGNPSEANRTEEVEVKYVLENVVNYNKEFGQHSLGLTLLQSIQSERRERSSINANDLPYEHQLWYNLGTAGSYDSDGISSNLRERQYASFMARLNYSLKDKYLLTLTGRTDGASMLAEGNKFTFFPAVAVAWKIANEPFISHISAIDDLKLRIGYGKTGNSSVDAYGTQGLLQRTVYAFGSNEGFGFWPQDDAIPNPNLKWETTSSYNIGIDFGLLRNRITGSVDVYRTETTDLLMERKLPRATGYANIVSNVGATQNQGIEAQVSAVVLNTNSGFKWTTGVTWFKNQEKIVKLASGLMEDPDNDWYVGQPIDTYKRHLGLGIWQDTPEDIEAMSAFNAKKSGSVKPGYVRIWDANGDSLITADDEVFVGNDVPNWIGSWINTFEYKSLELSFMFYTRQGHEVDSDIPNTNNSLAGRYQNRDVFFWAANDPNRANATYPRPDDDFENVPNRSVYDVIDGSFTKLRQVTLAYHLPQNVLSALKMQRAKIYLQAVNPVTWSKFELGDPEGDIDADTPSPRTLLFGVNLTF